MIFLSEVLRKLKKYSIPICVFLICSYALYMRMMIRAERELWRDEIVQIGIVDIPFISFVKSLPAQEFCSYISGDYYLTYPFVKIFGHNKWGLAIPHIAATILGFYILYLICKRHLKTIWGYIITFTVICFNATLAICATEIRTYAVLPTLALATFYFSEVLIEQYGRLNIKKKIAIGALFVLAIWFHAYGIAILFLPLSFCILVNFNDPEFRVVSKKIVRFIIIVLCIAMPLWFYSVFGPHKSTYNPNMHTFAYIPNPLVSLISFLKAIFGNLVGYQRLYFLLIGILFPFIIRYKDRFQQIAFLIITVFVPIALVLTAALIARYWFLQRHFIWVMPYFAFFLGWVWDSSLYYFFKERHFIKKTEKYFLTKHRD